jgi:hypothetical protein
MDEEACVLALPSAARGGELALNDTIAVLIVEHACVKGGGQPLQGQNLPVGRARLRGLDARRAAVRLTNGRRGVVREVGLVVGFDVRAWQLHRSVPAHPQ